MSSVRSKVAVVTGAASGIGRQLAFELARRGARLALSDVDELGLGETADRAKALGAEVHTARVDVSDRAAVDAYAAAVAGRFGVVHQVYNNAGVGPVAARCETATGPTTTASCRSTCSASSTAARRSCRP